MGNLHIIRFNHNPNSRAVSEIKKRKKNVNTFYIFHLNRGLGYCWMFFGFFFPSQGFSALRLTSRGSNILNLSGINNGRAHVRRRTHSLTCLTQESEKEKAGKCVYKVSQRGFREGKKKRKSRKFIIESWKQPCAPSKANFLPSIANRRNFFDHHSPPPPLQPLARLNNSPFNLCD